MQRWVSLGFWWLWVGMALSPVGEKVWNPGRPYHWSLAIAFLPPAVWLTWRHRRWLAAGLWQTLEFRGLLLLLGWSLLTEVHALHRVEDLPTLFFWLLLFISSWVVVQSSQPTRALRLLFWSGLGLAAAALAAMLAFRFRDVVWHDRLVGFGTLNNPNLAGFVYGAAVVWLLQLSVRRRLWRWLHGLAVVVLCLALALTFSRAAWLALLVSQGAMLLSRRRHLRKRSLLLLGLAALVIVLGGMHYMAQRGLSYRPQIFQQALELIERHPWLGLGVDGEYHIQVGNQIWLHSHNVLTHLAITVGLPGMCLWMALWLRAGWQGWRQRHGTTGRLLLACWVYASVACQFDAPHLFQQPDVEWVLLWLPLAMSYVLATAQRTAAGAAAEARP